MSKSRQFLFSTLIFVMLPPAALRAASGSVEYTGGTVKSIPANSTGSFNFDNSKELRFNFSGTVYALPYEQITSTDVAKGEGHHILRKIPVPSFRPGNRKETLTIAYKDAAGASGSLNFELTANQAAAARDTISAKKSNPQTANSIQSDDWWGDKYWKTNRNKDAWEGGAAQSGQPAQSAAPSGTK
jgi:hypothetical protein